MNKETKGKVDNMKGRVKQAAGSLTGDKGLEAEGAAERVKGAAQETFEKAKKNLRDDDKAADEREDDED